jgi:hypothetical protein
MDGPADSARIYLMSDDDRRVSPDGPAVVTPDGVRHDVPSFVCEAVMHVVEAMRAGMAVKVVPLRPELPIDEAAEAVGVRSSILRKYVANGSIPFRSSEHTDWVRLEDVIAWDAERTRMRGEGLEQMLNDGPWDEPAGGGTEP